jgi:exodeoxyribonuclease VII small subunit
MEKEVKKIKFEDKLNKLNEIADEISSNVLSLDKSISLYEKGLKIIKELEDELEAAKKKVEKIVDKK